MPPFAITRTIIGEANEETRPVFEEKARAMNAPIVFAEDNPHNDAARLMTDLRGSYQQKNANTILTAIDNLKDLNISEEHIKTGLANVCRFTGLKGRWQTLCKKPLTICDTGHNLAGWQYLSRQIAEQECKRTHIVFGMVDDKDIDGVMSLLPRNAIYYFTKACSHRAVASETLLEKGRSAGLTGKAFSSVPQAYKAAVSSAKANDFIFIGGSTYVVADLLKNCF